MPSAHNKTIKFARKMHGLEAAKDAAPLIYNVMCEKEMDNLKSDETLIEGQWLFDGKTMEADSACKRIDWLIQNNLKAIKTDESGWDTLYQDKKDKRYWLHYYPKSEMHGGGPPALKAISDKEASQMFGVTNAT